MIDLSITDFLQLPESQQVTYVHDSAILYAQQFTRADLDHYCRLADAARAVHKQKDGAAFLSSLLGNRTALNFFVQPSSRTFLSFSAAQAILGMRRMSLRDEKISSISKGESLTDSIRTFLSYVDLVVMRHYENHAAAAAFWIATKARQLDINGEERPIPIVSGGSGTRQHPTQALLDIYTLEKSFDKVGGIDGKTIMMVGDLKRGRTVRSLSYLMKNYRDVSLVFAAPERYQMDQDILSFLDDEGIPHREIDSIDAAVSEVDAIYMTRIQDEWDNLGGGSKGHVPTSDAFRFRLRHLDQMKPHACLMHPLPKRDEVEEEVDYADDPRVVYWRQERNGMWLRVAVIAKLFGVDDQILRVADSA
jgi:aspartate carbamoyltransferase catalytic subunit